jgi:hypothetical protein
MVKLKQLWWDTTKNTKDKYALHYIPLTYLCNKSISTGNFPTRLKYSQIIPILKNDNKTELTNYRPISLLTSFLKFFEKLIYTRLNKHKISYKILAN